MEHIMSTRNYDRIAAVCMTTALLSALLFDKLPKLHWLILPIGVASALTAASIYFYNRFLPQETGLEDSKAPDLTLARIEWHQPKTFFESNAVLGQMILREKDQITYYPAARRSSSFQISRKDQQEVGRRIVQALGATFLAAHIERELELECVVTRAGSFVFIVRNARMVKSLRMPEAYSLGSFGSKFDPEDAWTMSPVNVNALNGPTI
jgi:hypothetical protein